MRALRVLLCLMTAAAASLTAHAADDAQRLEERLPATAQPSPDQAPAPIPLPASEAALGSFPEFTLHAVAIEGLTALSQTDTAQCSSHLVGKTVTVIEVVELTQCLTALYRANGYFLSRAIVPPQEVAGGVLKVRAIEGYVAAVEATGVDRADADAHFASALNERPARLATFERALLLFADRYGHRVTSSQLAADPTDPARFIFRLGVSATPISWRIYADNRGTEAYGPEQLLGWVGFNGLLGNDRLAALLFLAPGDPAELVFGDLNYARAWGSGDVWTEVGASVSHSRDGSMPEIFAPVSEIERYYARINLPIVRTRAESLWANLAFDGRNTEQNEPLGADADEAVRAVRLSATYTRIEGGTRGDATLEIAHGLDAFGASANGEAGLTRADARPQFTKVRLDVSATHKLSDAWAVFAAAAGQLADGALVAAEEFGGGGARFGRAYDYSEIVGDHGLAGAAELRWNMRNAFDALTNIQIYAFADAVRIWNTGADASQLADADLSSAGGGLRITPVPGVNGTIELAVPWSRDVAAEADRSARVFVSLSVGW